MKISPAEMPKERYNGGKKLLETYSSGGKFNASLMMKILRDKKYGICRIGASASVTTASQVSVLKRNDQGQLECIHYFTATPNPLLSIFKPFTFGPNVDIGSKTLSPQIESDVTDDQLPDRSHELYKIHSNLKPLPQNNDPSARVNIDVDVMSNQIRLERELVNLKWPLSNVVFREAVDIELSIYECITSEDESVRSSISNIMQKANQLSLNC